MLLRQEIPVVVDTVLLESDLPDLLLARDQLGTMYLCSLAEVDKEGYLFLAVGISSERLTAFRSGTTDLRTILLEPELGVRYVARAASDDSTLPALNLLAHRDDVPEAWLPETGLLLSVFSHQGVSDDVVVRDAIARNAPVIICTLNPPEARGGESKVDADTLADYIAHFQSLVRHATKDALRHLKPKERKAALAEDFFALNVTGFSPGSFNVHFEAKDHANLLGLSRVGVALGRIDALMELAKKPIEEAREGFKGNPGHTLAAYESIMKFAVKAPFSYRWSDPGMTVPAGHSISSVEAAAIVAVLEHEEALKAERFEFVGHFTSVNTDKKPWSWTARDEEGRVRRGYVGEHNPTALDGVRIKTQQYRLSGEDRLIQPAAGRLAHKLFLSSAVEIP